jgi:putative sterol carrier protein
VAEFLSAEWVATLDAVVGATDTLADVTDEPFVLEQRVDLPGGGCSTHHLRLGPGRAHFVAGPADRPDVALHTDLRTAIAIARGEVNAQQALSRGTLRVRGRLQALVGAGDALASLDDVFTTVRSETTYPPADLPGDHR